jgi:glycosyltransferase involved in cell wall biosynthesis
MISIIIPSFNSGSYIVAALQSVLLQAHRPLEIIVIDDGSTDDSLAVIARCAAQHPDLIRYESGPNRGAPAARNRGLELAQGEYIKFLDADDLLLPDCLARQVAQASALPPDARAIVYGDALWTDGSGAPIPGHPHRPRRPQEDPVVHIVEQSPLITCPIHRRAYLEEIGGFDLTIPKGQEFDLHLRLVLAGVDFIHHPGAVFQYRQHPTPARISNRPLASRDPLAYARIAQRQMDLVRRQRGELSPDLSAIFAHRLWSYGRALQREGAHAAAAHYFAAARQLSPRDCVVGNPPYPTLVKLFGPRLAEGLQNSLRAWFTRPHVQS